MTGNIKCLRGFEHFTTEKKRECVEKLRALDLETYLRNCAGYEDRALNTNAYDALTDAILVEAVPVCWDLVQMALYRTMLGRIWESIQNCGWGFRYNSFLTIAATGSGFLTIDFAFSAPGQCDRILSDGIWARMEKTCRAAIEVEDFMFYQTDHVYCDGVTMWTEDAAAIVGLDFVWHIDYEPLGRA